LRGRELVCLLANNLITNREEAKNAKRREEKRREKKRRDVTIFLEFCPL
jgi:hypothetical protein